MTNSLFELRGTLSKQQRIVLEITGLLLILGVWSLISYTGLVRESILPPPWKVIAAFKELHFENALIRNTFKSVGLNFMGYIEAIAIALPIGFLIGLVPLFKGLFGRSVDTFRFIPLTAVTGLFIVWFGIETSMKVHFLAFGILVYLLPVVVQRIEEVKDVYLKTVYTLGATNWQTIRSVYLPAVLSKISDDIRVLVAISWTYIIIAELVNSTGGIGALIYQAGQRQGRIDKVFAILVVIILIGLLQDRIFILLDRWFFPHKHIQKGK